MVRVWWPSVTPVCHACSSVPCGLCMSATVYSALSALVTRAIERDHSTMSSGKGTGMTLWTLGCAWCDLRGTNDCSRGRGRRTRGRGSNKSVACAAVGGLRRLLPAFTGVGVGGVMAALLATLWQLHAELAGLGTAKTQKVIALQAMQAEVKKLEANKELSETQQNALDGAKLRVNSLALELVSITEHKERLDEERAVILGALLV